MSAANSPRLGEELKSNNSSRRSHQNRRNQPPTVPGSKGTSRPQTNDEMLDNPPEEFKANLESLLES